MTTEFVPTVPLPALLVVGVGAVVGTAGALSTVAARKPDLRADRWTRPLPRWVTTLVDLPGTRVALRVTGGVGAALAIIALATSPTGDHAARGIPGLAWIVALTLVAGPVWRLLNPVRLVVGDSTRPRGERPRKRRVRHAFAVQIAADQVGPATVSLAAVVLTLALSNTTNTQIAVVCAHVVVHAAAASWLGDRWLRAGDPTEVLAGLVGALAPVGRDHTGRLAWRDPVVAGTHAAPPDGAAAFTAVLIAAVLTLGRADPLWPPVVRAAGAVAEPVTLLVTAVLVTAVLRASIIRPFFRAATLPVVAAYGLLASGRWLAPLDLLVFVALHVVAVVLLHRQALARHDLRTARALQFLPRLGLVISVTVGLAALGGGS